MSYAMNVFRYLDTTAFRDLRTIKTLGGMLNLDVSKVVEALVMLENRCRVIAERHRCSETWRTETPPL
jgi:hypothetical protein